MVDPGGKNAYRDALSFGVEVNVVPWYQPTLVNEPGPA